eukprot:TRINITY_DN3250_c0_g1_i3.p1 TRINITY_DN3250_c0_g1~~TRINITY_DN3250_c0_g1_i3.p1  ORF type:complete len:357 (-),score=40.64 TRINITY_DN3250_c0_g1_i3:283-1353(-)
MSQPDVPITTTTQPSTDPKRSMRAVEWHGSKDIRVGTKPRPIVTDTKDVIVKVTSCTICGSDLHLYHNEIPQMKSGDILGHECMGVVESVGKEVTKIKVGDRVVVSAVIADGTCEYCQKGMYSLCDNTNPSGTQAFMFGGQRTAGLFGYSHLMGGYPGGQAEYIRVPFGDVNCLQIPKDLPDEKFLFLSDVLCTAWHACELGNVSKGDTVAIWGCGPIGLTAAVWSKIRGASKIIVIDSIQYRLDMARSQTDCDVINFSDGTDVRKAVLDLIPGGPNVCIDAVGFRYAKSITHRLEKLVRAETDAIDSLSEAIYACRKGGRVVMIGDYIGLANHFPVGPAMEKGLTLVGSQVPVCH